MVAIVGCRIVQPLGAGEDARVDAAVDVEVPDASDKLAWRYDLVAAGGYRSCASISGYVWCWGSHWNGSLGRDLMAAQTMPGVVPAVEGVTALAMGDRFTCALVQGSVSCWGENTTGQLGADGPSRATPARVALPGDVRAVVAGARSACARSDGDRWWCWGELVAGGAPREFAELAGAADVTLGFSHLCALWRDGATGRARCQGANGGGQLGDGTTTRRAALVDVRDLDGTPLTRVAEIRASDFSTCALLTDGHEVRCWGTITDRPVVRLRAVETLLHIGVGELHVCALTDGGRALCWGNNDDGQLGTGSHAPVSGTTMRAVALPDGVVLGALRVGTRHACARTQTSDALWCWGLNASGQLGAGDLDAHLAPVRVELPRAQP